MKSLSVPAGQAGRGLPGSARCTATRPTYSLDCDDGIEKAAIGWAQPSPEDYIVQKEEQAEHAELIRRPL